MIRSQWLSGRMGYTQLRQHRLAILASFFKHNDHRFAPTGRYAPRSACSLYGKCKSHIRQVKKYTFPDILVSSHSPHLATPYVFSCYNSVAEEIELRHGEAGENTWRQDWSVVSGPLGHTHHFSSVIGKASDHVPAI
jgi:hypothetical protein